MKTLGIFVGLIVLFFTYMGVYHLVDNHIYSAGYYILLLIGLYIGGKR